MGPGTFGKIGVGAGDVNRDGSDMGVDAFESRDWFFVEIGIDKTVPDAQQFGGTESPFVGSADEHGVLEGEFQSAVDDIETVVGAEGNLADWGGC